MNDQTSVTSISLLQRIRRDESDPHAWDEFVHRYGRRIFEWCINRRLQTADAEDVTQNVLLKLANRLSSFEYDPQMTFRGWLRRTTENAVIDFFRERKSRGDDLKESIRMLDDAAARADLTERMESAFDLELFEEAKCRVKRRVDSRRWQAWEMIAVHNASGEHVAAELNMKLPSVYSSRYQIQKLIAEEVRQLDTESCGNISQTGDAV
ncbi:MAG: sigma-70 family RNA polymerase sigma factor [Planctomycetaceae bacterium]|nr:sigma-70 family RNA polymerase sigma factor [Planctomycetaceae bacterium]